MTARISVNPHAWVLTDVTARVEKASRGACDIVGSTLSSGDDLLQFLPIQRRTLRFDIEVALTGWPAQRTVLVRLATQRWSRFGYRVSRRLKSKGVGLLWQLEAQDDRDGVEPPSLECCA